jgi:Putative MetA-pathway of phenol degradation
VRLGTDLDERILGAYTKSYLSRLLPCWRLRARISSFLLIGLLHGQTPDDPITTDRPAVANASTVVPKGSLQFENGFLISKSSGQQTVDGPETSIRFGVTGNTELRFSAPDYFDGASSGFGDISIGVKQQLGPVAAFDVSLIAFLSLPRGAHAISSHGYDPGVQLPWSRKLSDNWTAGGQLAVYWPTQVGGRNVTGESTFLLDRQITKPMDAFFEYAGDFPQRGGPRHLLHFGAAYKVAPRQQIDVHVGVGLSAAVDHFVGVGYSFRFQAVGR